MIPILEYNFYLFRVHFQYSNSVYTYYFDEETGIMYKYTDGSFVEAYIEDAMEWMLVGVDAIKGQNQYQKKMLTI